MYVFVCVSVCVCVCACVRACVRARSTQQKGSGGVNTTHLTDCVFHLLVRKRKAHTTSLQWQIVCVCLCVCISDRETVGQNTTNYIITSDIEPVLFPYNLTACHQFYCLQHFGNHLIVLQQNSECLTQAGYPEPPFRSRVFVTGGPVGGPSGLRAGGGC